MLKSERPPEHIRTEAVTLRLFPTYPFLHFPSKTDRLNNETKTGNYEITHRRHTDTCHSFTGLHLRRPGKRIGTSSRYLRSDFPFAHSDGFSDVSPAVISVLRLFHGRPAPDARRRNANIPALMTRHTIAKNTRNPIQSLFSPPEERLFFQQNFTQITRK